MIPGPEKLNSLPVSRHSLALPWSYVELAILYFLGRCENGTNAQGGEMEAHVRSKISQVGSQDIYLLKKNFIWHESDRLNVCAPHPCSPNPCVEILIPNVKILETGPLGVIHGVSVLNRIRALIKETPMSPLAISLTFEDTTGSQQSSI